MKSLTQPRLFAFLFGAVFLIGGFTPFSAEAASPKPTCTLTVATEAGKAEITKTGDVIIHKGGHVTVAWETKNATAARYNGGKAALTGSQTYTPERTTTYIFEASSGSHKATCKVTAHIADATADEVTSGSKPTISGEATGTTKVTVAIYEKGRDKAIFEKKNVSVKKGAWQVKLTKDLDKGDYDVRLMGDKSYELNLISTASLKIDTKNTLSGGSSKGLLNVTTIPLLSGGTTRAGASVPVAYLQLRNTGSEAVQVTGFNVRQNGTASTGSILTLSTVDDKGLSRGLSAVSPFKANEALAPTDSTIEPGTLKLFTIKVTLGANVTVGTNLMLDVTGVESNATETGAFPLRGTTWAIGY